MIESIEYALREVTIVGDSEYDLEVSGTLHECIALIDEYRDTYIRHMKPPANQCEVRKLTPDAIVTEGFHALFVFKDQSTDTEYRVGLRVRYVRE